MNKKISTLFEQVIITTERTRELRKQRYGALETGFFDPNVNKRLPSLVDQALEDVETGKAGREYLIKAVERRTNNSREKFKRK
jgi:DNA-directed RNA polymerase subunit K/omega